MRRISRPALQALLLVALALGRSAGLSAFPVAFGGMACDLPEGWTVLSSSEGSFAATSGDVVTGTGVFQALWLPGSTHAAAADLLDAVTRRLDAEREASEFVFDGRTAVLAEVAFRAGPAAARGYLLCVDGTAPAESDVAILAYADEASFTAQEDFLLSAMDSLRIPAGRRGAPGPIYQFLSPYPREAAVTRVRFGSGTVPVRSEPEELDALRALIEREARILVPYAGHPARDEAWKRYYRAIERTSSPLLAETARAIGELAGSGERPPAEVALAVLSWLQGFEFARTGSLSDLESPLEAAATRRGDCDARALLYVIVLAELGMEGAILVSSAYAHAVAAVALEAPGVGFTLDGRRYLVAETTTPSPLGWIAEEQRDLSRWLVVRFHEPR